jgi:hypothetical protein
MHLLFSAPLGCLGVPGDKHFQAMLRRLAPLLLCATAVKEKPIAEERKSKPIKVTSGGIFNDFRMICTKASNYAGFRSKVRFRQWFDIYRIP